MIRNDRLSKKGNKFDFLILMRGIKGIFSAITMKMNKFINFKHAARNPLFSNGG